MLMHSNFSVILMSSNPDTESTELKIASSSTEDAPKPPIEPIHLPTMEEIRGQDIWNNCAVRSVVSGVMGILSDPILFDIS